MLSWLEEKKLFESGVSLIAAVDEAGRGPLAGPVVAACVLVRPGFDFENPKYAKINDSKKLSEKNREELFDIILSDFSETGVGWCDNLTIDKINILEATFLSMKKALGCLKTRPEHILVDGKLKITNISQNQSAIVDGDASVFSIAAASILAKVTRDRMMKSFHEKFPQYGFDQHKGYGTKVHMEMIKKYGPCPIHRMSFAPLNKMK